MVTRLGALRRPWGRVNFLRVLLTLQVLLGLAGVVTWQVDRLRAPEAPPLPRPEPDPAAPRPATLEGSYHLALARAMEFAAGSRLVGVAQQVEGPRELGISASNALPPGGWLSYVFAGETGGRTATFTVVIERANGTIITESVLPWTADPPAEEVTLQAYTVGSTFALRAAEGVAGLQFRRACPANRQLTRLTLSQEGDAPPLWRVTYLDDRLPDKNALTVEVGVQAPDIGGVVERPVEDDPDRPC